MSTPKITINQYEERDVYNEALKKLCLVITEGFFQKKRVLIFLSGGLSVNLYAKLSEWIASKKDIGGSLAFAEVDERFRPEGSKKTQNSKLKAPSYAEASAGRQNRNLKLKNNINSEMIKETGLWEKCQKLRIPFHLISQKGTLDEAADEYNQTLERLFKEYDFKIAVLGIGEDGHTAGLLPGYRQKWDLPRFAAGYENEGKFKNRISLTPKALRKLDYALVVVKGAKKRNAIEKLLKKDANTDFDKYPAAIIRNITGFDLYTDINL